MKLVAVLYATSEGHTRRIAEHIVGTLIALGYTAELIDVEHIPNNFKLRRCIAAILAASVHFGRHQPEMIAYVKANRAVLESMPTAFMSVSLAAATMGSPEVSAAEKAKGADEVQGWLDLFFEETGWHSTRVHAVAGASLYKELGLLRGFVVRMYSHEAGADTEPSDRHEYTNWEGLDVFVTDLATQLINHGPHPPWTR